MRVFRIPAQMSHTSFPCSICAVGSTAGHFGHAGLTWRADAWGRRVPLVSGLRLVEVLERRLLEVLEERAREVLAETRSIPDGEGGA